MILVTTFTLFRLATGSLRDRVEEQLTAMSESLAQTIGEQIQTVRARENLGNTTAFQQDSEIENALENLLKQQDELLYIVIQDLKGQVVWKAIRRGMELEQNQFSRILISPRNSRAPKIEISSLANPNMNYFDLIEPVVLDERPELIVHFGVDKSVIEKRFSRLRRSIIGRILLGSGVVTAVISLGLVYVLWLLRRAQIIEAEAHTADRLAYVGTLASGLAHEIRNPLSAINLNLQMIEEDLTTGFPDGVDLKVLLKGTKQEIKRLDRLATNFLMYAKPLEIEKQRFDLWGLLDELTELVQNEFAAAGIDLIKEGHETGLIIQADRDLLQQAVLNLVVNAQEAVLENPDSDRCVTISASQDAGQIFVAIRDNGPGVGVQEARSLFQLFYSGKRGGTGLGLPISQRIVEAHGGRIEWHNQPLRGAEFRIVLNS
jgi:signal transduction histidine kinase